MRSRLALFRCTSDDSQVGATARAGETPSDQCTGRPPPQPSISLQISSPHGYSGQAASGADRRLAASPTAAGTAGEFGAPPAGGHPSSSPARPAARHPLKGALLDAPTSRAQPAFFGLPTGSRPPFRSPLSTPGLPVVPTGAAPRRRRPLAQRPTGRISSTTGRTSPISARCSTSPPAGVDRRRTVGGARRLRDHFSPLRSGRASLPRSARPLRHRRWRAFWGADRLPQLERWLQDSPF